MRTALVLLFLLALAAVPGSVVPQENIDAVKVANWQEDHPALTPIYEKLGLFSVYSSPWFSRDLPAADGLARRLLRAAAADLLAGDAGEAAAPCRVASSRLPESRRFEIDERRRTVLERDREGAAPSALPGRRRRDDGGSSSAEKGYLREAGNLLFHFAVLVVLVGFAFGQLFGYKGGVITIVGQGFSNTLSQYDDFAPGSLFDPDDLDPLSLTVDDFHVKWLTSGPEMGQPESFDAERHLPHEPDRRAAARTTSP